jgi:hypothetical protein
MLRNKRTFFSSVALIPDISILTGVCAWSGNAQKAAPNTVINRQHASLPLAANNVAISDMVAVYERVSKLQIFKNQPVAVHCHIASQLLCPGSDKIDYEFRDKKKPGKGKLRFTGLFIVLSIIYMIPVLGARKLVILSLEGQVLMAMIVRYLGILESPEDPITI